MVERETQKGIIIGHKGGALKKVGVGARLKLQAFFTKKIHLELYVKVNKDWRSNERQLEWSNAAVLKTRYAIKMARLV